MSNHNPTLNGSIKKLYVSGAITGVEKWAEKWRKEWKEKLTKAGFSVFDPMLDGQVEGERMVKTIVNRDIQRIITADGFILNAEKASWGAGMEIPYARLFRKTIVTIYPHTKREEIPIWLEYHSDYIYPSLDEFLKTLRPEEKKEEKKE